MGVYDFVKYEVTCSCGHIFNETRQMKWLEYRNLKTYEPPCKIQLKDGNVDYWTGVYNSMSFKCESCGYTRFFYFKVEDGILLPPTLVTDAWSDPIGGHHDCAIGYNPNGVWCGECCRETCEGCDHAEATEEML